MLGVIILILVLAWIGYEAYNGSRREKKEEKLLWQQRKNTYTYRDLLRTDEWRSRKKEILNRDNHKCCWCGSSKYLQIHHRYYDLYPDDSFVEPWDYLDDALMTLCKRCHEKAHKLYGNKVYYRKFSEHYN